ncbi:hypothetical protein D3OALGA1CA_1511 [Olavius algarvensis associated proteobacterium Delta 3]|nr:hypothetical protein D3OALGB2SA_312 [Olavius algarvensis associated proteobacterium Delta 3]CAB5102262.1 hypothetical protein D3OALGA1CA_1511 [Olavius algarvensis associated proteobacterium Delta 3]
MHDIKGMAAASPIGFLSALGMLRVLASDRGLDVKLGWQNGHAVIEGIDPESAINELMANMTYRSESLEFNWADSTRKVPPEIYRKTCKGMLDDRRALEFMAGWATDAVLYNGYVKPTRMDMTSGAQKLLRDLRGLAQRVERKHFKVALLGGKYEGQSSFGLDPIAVRSHAHERQAPTKSKAPGKPGSVWLAFESIPLHPVIPISANRAITTGWRAHPDSAYVWPIWDAFLCLEEVSLLRTLPLEKLHERPGVTEVWSASYGSSGKYGMLYPPWREH